MIFVIRITLFTYRNNFVITKITFQILEETDENEIAYLWYNVIRVTKLIWYSNNVIPITKLVLLVE